MSGAVTLTSGVASYGLFLVGIGGSIEISHFDGDPSAQVNIYEQSQGIVSSERLFTIYACNQGSICGYNWVNQASPSSPFVFQGKSLYLMYTTEAGGRGYGNPNSPYGWTVKYYPFMVCPPGFYGGGVDQSITCTQCAVGVGGLICNPTTSTTPPVPTTSRAPTTTPRPALPQCTQNMVISTYGEVVAATCANGVVTFTFRWGWVTGIPPNSKVTIGTPYNWLDNNLYLFYPGQYAQYLVDKDFNGKYMGYFLRIGSDINFYDMTLYTGLVGTSYLMVTGGDMLYTGPGNGYPMVILWGNASMPDITTPPPTTTTTPPAVTQAWPDCPQLIVVTQANYKSVFNSNPPCIQGSITTQYVERTYMSKYGWGFGPIPQGTLIVVTGYTQDPDGSVYAGPVYSTGMGNDVHQTVITHMFDRYSTASWACTSPECWVNYYPGYTGQATGLTLTWGSNCDCAIGFYISAPCTWSSDLARCTICPANFFCQYASESPVACPLGSVSAPGSSSILSCACPAGTLGEVSSATVVCTACPANMFCTGAICSPTQCGICANCSSTTSSACPAHTWSAPSASSISNCTCEAGAFALGAGLACDFCGTGKYTSGLGMTTCQNCTKGKYQTGMGMQSVAACQLCLSGTYNSMVGASVCTSCAPGTYTWQFSRPDGATLPTECLYCPKGTFGVTPGECPSCDGGEYNTGVGVTVCETCPAGTYNDDRFDSSIGSACDSCLVGTYSLTIRAYAVSFCLPCGVGFYCLTVATAPQPCTGLPINAIWTTSGTLPDNCGFLCSPSYYRPGINGSLRECRACPANSWCISNLIHSCPANYKSEVLSFDPSQCYICSICNMGSFQTTNCSMFNNTGCALCKSGTYASSTGKTSCQTCSTGTYLTGSGMQSATDCLSCAAGSYNSATGVSACTLCGNGTYASSTGMTSCQPCSTGTYQTGSGMESETNCLSCAAGSYNSATGVSACTLCEKDTFSTAIGASTGCSTCTLSCWPGEYASSTCTATKDTQCTTCTACDDTWEYTSSTCTATKDTQCASCTACGIGKYESTVCSFTSDTGCTTCGSCTNGKYASFPCTTTNNIVCDNCTACTVVDTACTNTRNTVCMPPCVPGSTYSATGVGPCTPCTPCIPGYTQTAPCTATADTSCIPPCDVCETGVTYSSVRCNATTVCTACITCNPGVTYTSSVCIPTANTVCSACSACVRGVNYATSRCNISSNTVCSNCTVCEIGTYLTGNCSTFNNTICTQCMSGMCLHICI